jgi:adenine phosphoribosyltransferase
MPVLTDLRNFIRDIPDFPKPGIVFKDVTPMLASGQAFRHACYAIAGHFWDWQVDLVAGPESRGFLFGTGVALELNAGMVPLRKPGKLPHETISHEYELEYGNDSLEMHLDAVRPGHKVLIVDDLLATGGTAVACCELIRKAGGEIIGSAFVVELGCLEGRKKLEALGVEVFSLVEYDSE